MTARPTAYYRPETLEEALQLLTKPGARPLSGGTKLLANGFGGEAVDLQALGLDQIEWDADGVTVGATATLTTFAEALDGRSGPSALLSKAIRQAGANTWRHAATLGGCVAARLQDSELLAVLLILNAKLRFADGGAMALDEYLGMGERPSGLITALYLAWEEGVGNAARVARTPRDYPIVAIVGWQPTGGAVRLAATGIGKRPFRLIDSESALTTGYLDTAVESASAACVHPGDFRGGAAYRAEMAATLVRRVLGGLNGEQHG